MTEALFRDDAYTRTCEAVVTAINDRGGIVLDRSIFYPTGGGQPGDRGVLRHAGGETRIATTVKGETPDEIVHVPDQDQALPEVGATVTAEIDWDFRHRLMRMHTCMHLLSAILPYPVTGGSVGAEKGRLDFDIPEAILDKDEIAARLAELVAAGHPVSSRWITDQELADSPELVKTMSVKPPTGQGRVRLIAIDDGQLDLQPCGGTHVANTAEIGAITVRKIEKKGKQNRRVNLAFAE